MVAAVAGAIFGWLYNRLASGTSPLGSVKAR